MSLFPSRKLDEGTTVVQLTSGKLRPRTLLGASTEAELRTQIQVFANEAGQPDPIVGEERPGRPCWTAGVDVSDARRKPNGFDRWFDHDKGEFFVGTS